jgi:xylan 1,4-beta-xylosidase
MLHGLGTELVTVQGHHETVDAWLVAGEKSATLMLTNFALPRHPIETQQVSFALKGAGNIASATIRRIDLEHANAKRHWEQVGKPEYLSCEMVAQLDAASQLKSEAQPFARDGEEFRIDVTMPPQSVASIELFF